jgi:uncharacterized protein (DUF427 family)
MPPETRVETSPKRIRVLLGGEWVADSTDAKLIWEKPYYPTYNEEVDVYVDEVLQERPRTKFS